MRQTLAVVIVPSPLAGEAIVSSLPLGGSDRPNVTNSKRTRPGHCRAPACPYCLSVFRRITSDGPACSG